MTIRRVTDLTCGECGNTQEGEVWDTINVQINPELKGKLLEGKVNFFHCNKCGFKAFIPMELLYHDMEKKFCVRLSPFQMVDNKEFLDRFTSEGILNIGPELPYKNIAKMMANYFQNIHVVFSMDELARYIIFRDKLAKHKAGASNSYLEDIDQILEDKEL